MEFIRKNHQNTIEAYEYECKSGDRIPLLRFPLLEETGLVSHCFTTRMGGVSQGIYSSMNLSFSRGDDPEAVQENFRRVGEALGTVKGKIVTTDQTHTTNIRRVTEEDWGKGIEKTRDYSDVDGLITNRPGVVLSTFYADCVPLYFIDPVHKAIGLSHSGWRGTVGRMGKVTLEAMEEAFGTVAEDVIAAIGPSICKDCYEVSEDVAEHFRREFPDYAHEILTEKGNGKFLLDLWRTNEIVLLDAGVLPEHLAIGNLCTCCNSKLLFSHRASQGRRGNLGAFLMLKETEIMKLG